MRPKPTIKVKDIVLVANVNLPRGKWPLEKITDLKPSRDDQVCTVKVMVAGI